MEKDRIQGYVAGLEQILRSSYLSLKDAVAHFQDMCQMVTPERNLSHDIIVDIRKTYREIQDQLTKVKGVQQLLEGKYRSYYHRNPLRDREIMEFGFIAKNYHFKFEYMLKEMEARRKLREQERPPRQYGQMMSAPWFHAVENQAILLRILRSLNDFGDKISVRLEGHERRQVVRNRPPSLSLFVLSGEVNAMDDLESRIRLREYDITERYGPDEFRGALTHLKEISVAEGEKVMRRFMQSREFSELKCLLFPIQSSNDLRKEVLGSTKRLFRGLAAGQVKRVSI